MAKTDQSKLVKLMQDMASPQVIADIDRALEENEREREDLLDLRKMAVRRHGEVASAQVENSKNENDDAEEAAHPVRSSMTVAGLAERYKSDPDSNFLTLSYSTREQYEQLLKLVLRDHGDEYLSNINARVLKQWHENWSEGGTGAIAHSKIGQLRRLFGFGATMLEDADCTRLSLVLNKLKFEVPKGRTEKMTPEYADAIRKKAHEMKRPSVALAQAFQFDLRLRQKDVIGDWIPVDERGESKLIDGNRKWVRGLQWGEIDDKLILRKQTTYGDIAFDLHMAPMVMAELRRQFKFEFPVDDDRTKLPESGPVILSEHDNLPWSAPEFRRWWRQVADAAGVPSEIRNSDSRKAD